MGGIERRALQALAEAAGRVLNDESEASPDVRTEMRERLARAEQAAWDVLRSGTPAPLGRRRDVNGELDAAVNPGAWKDRSVVAAGSGGEERRHG